MAGLLFALSLSGFLSGAIGIGKALLGLGFVIFVHELGHFLVAKACGVKCEKFYIGFDIPIRIGPWTLQHLGRFKWGETEYGIGIVPLGGYVKMLGQDDNPGNAEAENERCNIKDAQGNTVLDPRSYKAKSVPARMAIISAGVIMNVIFAVILAAVAYRSGVTIEPTELGGTIPGDPGWMAGLEPGDKVIQIGRDGEPDEHLRFLWDMRQAVAEIGLESDDPTVDMLIQRRNGSKEWFTLHPTKRLVKRKASEFVTLGIYQSHTTTLDRREPALIESVAHGKFEKGDRIIAVNGQELSRDGANHHGDFPSYELDELLNENLTEAITLTVERRSAPNQPDRVERVDVKLPPSPLKVLGLEVEIGPITGVRPGSPAARAGVQAGDVLTKVNGEPVGDPNTLPQRLAQAKTEEFRFEFTRKEGPSSKSVEVTMKPSGRWDFDTLSDLGCPIGLLPFGMAYEVSNIVKSVAPDSSAAKEGLRPGDQLTSAHLHAAKAELDVLAKQWLGSAYADPITLSAEQPNWPYVQHLAQVMLSEMTLRVSYKRGDKIATASLSPMASNYFDIRRGLRFTGVSRIHQADSWGEAFTLGLRETKENLIKVVRFLKLIVRGRISPKLVSGPLGIIGMAGAEASEGWSRLLLFLTMLSANLAILNFLPIPALDGGHMMFLAYEAIFRRPVNERMQIALTLAGVSCLLLLIAFASYNDVTRLLGIK